MERWEAPVAPPPGVPEDGLWWCVQGNRVLLGDGGALPGAPPADGEEPLFIGVLGGRAC